MVQMKKKLWLVVLAVILSLQGWSLAYDYREEPLSEAELVVLNEIRDNDEIKIPLDYYETYKQIGYEIDWSKARKAYYFLPWEFQEIMENGTWEEAVPTEIDAVYELPLRKDDGVLEYISARICEGGATWASLQRYSLVGGNSGIVEAKEYLFRDDLIPEELDTEDASVYLIVLSDDTFVTVVKETDVTMIPFSNDPDLLGLKNGELYTPEEVYEAVSTSTKGYLTTGQLNRGFGAVLLLVVSFIAALNIANKREKQRVGTGEEERETLDAAI